MEEREEDRLCGTCGELKPASAFYKDGKTPDGKTRRRRDCIDCYKKTRVAEEALKPKPLIPKATRRRKKK